MNDLICELDHNASKTTLGDLLLFIDWMHRADAALEQAEALPPRPEIESEKVNAWVQLIQKVEERHRLMEEKRVALEANLIPLAVIGVLTSVVSAFYYVRIIVNMYLRDGDGDKAEGATEYVNWAIYVAFAGTIIMGILPFLEQKNMSDQMEQIAIKVSTGGHDYSSVSAPFPPTGVPIRVSSVAHNQKLAWMICPSTSLPPMEGLKGQSAPNCVVSSYVGISGAVNLPTPANANQVNRIGTSTRTLRIQSATAIVECA